MSTEFVERRSANLLGPGIDSGPASLGEYWMILRRRQLLFFVPVALILAVVVLVAFSLPAVYRSQARILIEDQGIPENIVGGTASNYASQQIQLITQRLLSTSSIQAVVAKFGLYGSSDRDKPLPPTVVASLFRENMHLEVVSADVIDARGRAGEAAIAFTLAFKHRDPLVAQKVTEELVQLFLSENARSSSAKTTQVSELLEAALSEANAELTAAEKELAGFKEENEGALPEMQQLNVTTVNRLDEQLGELSSRINGLQQRRIELMAQLSALSPSAPVTLPSGETILSDRERLQALELEYRRKSAVYEPNHPDILALKREIESLERTVGQFVDSDQLRQQLLQEKDRLSALRERYSDNHPDVQRSMAAISEIESQLGNNEPNKPSTGRPANNPAYVLLETQLRSAELELRSLQERRQGIQARIDELEELIRRAPRVEMEYEALLRKYDNARAGYSDLEQRLRAAEVAADVEQEITGRRFSLLEPAVFPVAPSSPNRQAIIVLGTLFAIAVGAGIVLLAEIIDDSIRTRDQVTKIVGSPPVVVIPYINNVEDLENSRTRRNRIMAAMGLLGVLVASYLAFVV